MTLATSFRQLRTADPPACAQRYKVLAKALGGVRAYGGDTPIPLLKVLETNGLDDALWCLRAVLPGQEAERDRRARLLACDYAEGKDGRVLALFETRFPQDKRPREAIETARRYAVGKATREELVAAASAASFAYAATYTASASFAYAASYPDAAAASACAGSNAWAEERAWQTERLRFWLQKEKAK